MASAADEGSFDVVDAGRWRDRVVAGSFTVLAPFCRVTVFSRLSAWGQVVVAWDQRRLKSGGYGRAGGYG